MHTNTQKSTCFYLDFLLYQVTINYVLKIKPDQLMFGKQLELEVVKKRASYKRFYINIK